MNLSLQRTFDMDPLRPLGHVLISIQEGQLGFRGQGFGGFQFKVNHNDLGLWVIGASWAIMYAIFRIYEVIF